MRFLFDQNILHRIIHILPESFTGSTIEKFINNDNYGCFEVKKKKK